MVTSGAQGALHLLAARLLGPGDVVLVEQPTYPNALEAFRRTGARLVPFPVTGEGWDLDLLAETFASLRPRLAYLQPDFQNPTGALLDTRGRELLVALARRSGTLLLIDETHVELDLSGQQMPAPTAALERDGQVVTVGSLSKVVWGGLRIGWIRSAPRMIADLVGERSAVDLGGPVLDHLIGAEVLERLPGVLDARRLSLAAARDLMIDALGRHLPEWICPPAGGGLSIWARLDGPYSSDLEAAAERHRRTARGRATLRCRRHAGALPAPALHAAGRSARRGRDPARLRVREPADQPAAAVVRACVCLSLPGEGRLTSR